MEDEGSGEGAGRAEADLIAAASRRGLCPVFVHSVSRRDVWLSLKPVPPLPGKGWCEVK